MDLNEHVAWQTEKRLAAEQGRELNWDLYYPSAEVDSAGNKVVFDPQGNRVPDESKDKSKLNAEVEAATETVEEVDADTFDELVEAGVITDVEEVEEVEEEAPKAKKGK